MKLKVLKYFGIVLISLIALLVVYGAYIQFFTPKYKIVRIKKEGLGNQLFQYAFAYALKQEGKQEVVFDMWDYKRSRKEDRPWVRFFANDYNFRFPILQERENPIAWAIRMFVLSKQRSEKGKSETEFYQYKSDVIDVSGNVVYRGFRQNALYFDKYRDGVIKMFKDVKGGLDKKNLEVIKQMQSHKNSVVINVRLGDYLSKEHSTAFYLCKPEDYNEAMKQFENLPDVHFFVFSDDIESAKKLLKFTKPYTFVDVNPLPKAQLNLVLSASAKHNIVSNSTFAFWAAYMNENKNKIIVAPKYWFYVQKGKYYVETNNLFPKDFNIIYLDNINNNLNK